MIPPERLDIDDLASAAVELLNDPKVRNLGLSDDGLAYFATLGMGERERIVFFLADS